jgi:ABC-type bacteriocin/lantibiotic exporter with double-glycine peptidase domain
MSMEKLLQLGQKHGLEVRGWKLRMNDLPGAKFPLILYFNNHHFVVADSVDAKGFVFVRDPFVGRLRFPPGRMAERWKGEALVFADRR